MMQCQAGESQERNAIYALQISPEDASVAHLRIEALDDETDSLTVKLARRPVISRLGAEVFPPDYVTDRTPASFDLLQQRGTAVELSHIKLMVTSSNALWGAGGPDAGRGVPGHVEGDADEREVHGEVCLRRPHDGGSDAGRHHGAGGAGAGARQQWVCEPLGRHDGDRRGEGRVADGVDWTIPRARSGWCLNAIMPTKLIATTTTWA